MSDDPAEEQENGIMSYNVIRDMVNRYVASVKLFDEQLEMGLRMNAMVGGFFKSAIAFQATEEGKPKTRADFKKELQKSGWKYIFAKMNMEKFTTKGLKDDINKFVEQQTNVPFTMRNIYKMIDIVIGTTSQRMDRALLEVFDKLTGYYHDNRWNLEGWKTNSHFLVNRKFIMPYVFSKGWSGQVECRYGGNVEILEDLVKALCFITGDNYDDQIGLYNFCRYRYKLKNNGKYLRDENYPDISVHVVESDFEDIMAKKKARYEKGIHSELEDSPVTWSQWFEWSYFRVRVYKKGTTHFEFKDEELWGKFNQRIAKIKGYPLFEGKEQTAYQKRNTGRMKKAA